MKKSRRIYLAIGWILFVVASCTKPKEPEYLSFKNIRITKAGLSESVVGADLRYYNPNGFDLKLKEADVDLYINDKYVGHSSLDTLIHIPALDTFYIPVSIELKLGDLLKNTVQLLLNPEVTLRIEGNAKVGRSGFYRKLPVNYERKERIDLLLKDSSIRELLNNF